MSYYSEGDLSVCLCVGFPSIYVVLSMYVSI